MSPRRRTRSAAMLACGLGVLMSAMLGPGQVSPAAALRLPFIVVPVGFRTGPVLVLRPDRLDIALDGRVLRAVLRTGPLDLGALPELVSDSRFVIRLGPGEVRLRAPLLERPHTSVVASTLDRLVLDGGVGLYGTDATLTLSSVTVQTASRPSGSGPGSGSPGAAAPGGGFLRYERGSVITLRDVRLISLGTPGAHPTPALRVGRSDLELTDCVVTGGGPGLQVQSAPSLALTRVSVQRAGGDGIVIDAPGRLGLTGLTVLDSHGTGLRLTGGTGVTRVDGPIVVVGSTGDGVDLRDDVDLTVAGVRTARNHRAGVAMRAVGHLTLLGATSDSDGVAVDVDGSRQVTLSGLRVRHPGVGISVKAVSSLRIEGTRIEGAAADGIDLSGQDIAVNASTVAGSTEGLVVEGGSDRVSVQASALSGTRDGLRIAVGALGVQATGLRLSSPVGAALRSSGATTTVTGSTLTGAVGVVTRAPALRLDLAATQVTATGTALDLGRGTGGTTVLDGTLTGGGREAVLLEGAELDLRGTAVHGGGIGIDAHGRLVASAVVLTATTVGIRVGQAATAIVDDATITSGRTGVAAARTASATLNQTDVHAPDPSDGPVVFHGDNRFSHLPVRWLGLAVLIAVTAAVAMEIVRKWRDRSLVLHGTAPVHVLNRN